MKFSIIFAFVVIAFEVYGINGIETSRQSPAIEICSGTMVGNVEKDGNCECGDTTKGFQTYTFMQDDVQRCFTVFHPLERAGEVLPVVFFSSMLWQRQTWKYF